MIQEEKNKHVPITWKLILNVMLFRDKELKYSKKAKFYLSLLLWVDVVGLILLIWGLVIFYYQLISLIILIKNMF